MFQFNRVRYKEKAKNIYRNNVVRALVAGLVIWLFGVSSDSGRMEISTTGSSAGVNYSANVTSPFISWLPIALGVITILSIILLIIFMPITTMAENYLRELAQGKKEPAGLVIWKKNLFFRIAGIVILQTIGIIMGFILLVIPGIYLMYAWRYVAYIAIDEPDLPIMDVFSKSMTMVNGNKLNLFIMDISFFGWYLVVGLVASLSFGLLGWVASIILIPYTTLTDAFAYEALKSGNNMEEDWVEEEIDAINEDIIDI